MCDELTERDTDNYLRKRGMTRRDFNKLGMGAALAVLLPPVTA
jgi:carboxymethylenebutenolidase